MTRSVLNTSTIIDPFGPVPLEEELAACHDAGYTEVELRGPRVAGRADLPALLDAHELTALSVNAVELGRGDEAVEQAAQYAEVAAACSIPYVLCVPGPQRDGLEPALEKVATIVADAGATLAFEFMGFTWSAVRTLREACSVARAVGDLPVVLDYFHWLAGPNRSEDLEQLRSGELVIAHVNDAPDGEVASMADADRVLPGQGAQPVGRLTRDILATGYDGPMSVELFDPRLWDLGPATAARLAHASMAGFGAGLAPH